MEKTIPPGPMSPDELTTLGVLLANYVARYGQRETSMTVRRVLFDTHASTHTDDVWNALRMHGLLHVLHFDVGPEIVSPQEGGLQGREKTKSLLLDNLQQMEATCRLIREVIPRL